MPIAWFAALTFVAALAAPSPPPVRVALKVRVLLRGSVAATSPFLEVRWQLLDVLTKPLVPADTVWLQRTDIETTFAKKGRDHATVLAQRFRH